MEKLRIVPFEPAHLQAIEAREFEAREMLFLPDMAERVRDYMARGMAYTGFLGDKILMCAGIVVLWRGVGEVWSVTTPLVTKYPLTFHRTMSRVLGLLERSMGLWRIQVAIHANHYVSQRWIERLGFEFESFKPGYGPDGSRYVGFARLRPELLPASAVTEEGKALC
jgi:hypothetical protein